jgi:hypothetical protein
MFQFNGIHLMNTPCINSIRAILCYCPDTGRITWVARRFGVTVGSEAGTEHKGYKRVKVFGKLILAHRLAWALHHGEWPEEEIDHINRNRSDNRIANLRKATRSGNMINRKYPTGASGITGVSKHRCGWQATIRIKKKSVHLGLFKTVEEASAARSAAEKAIYGSFSPEGEIK